jgi:hypothetical protein
MRRDHCSPGDFTRVFASLDTSDKQREEVETLKALFECETPGIWVERQPINHLSEAPGPFTRYFGAGERTSSNEEGVGGASSQTKLLTARSYGCTDACQATQIARFQPPKPQDEAAVPQMHFEQPSFNAAVTSPAAPQQPGVSMGFVVLLLCGLTVCLHLEALFILLWFDIKKTEVLYGTLHSVHN